MELHILCVSHKDFQSCLKAIAAAHGKDRLSVSKSYSGSGMALCISDDYRVTVDMEEHRHRSPGTIAYFTDRFASFSLTDKPKDADSEWFYAAWTAMESYFKFAGAGFNTSKDFTIDVDSGAVYKKDDVAAYLRFIRLRDFHICLCSEQPLADEDVTLLFHGWGGTL